MQHTPGKPIRTYNDIGEWRDWSTDELVGNKYNYLKGWKCGAGVENLFIDMDGNVWTASCREGGRLGNVFQNFSIPDKWIDCTKDICSCGADLFIPKVSKIEFKNLLNKSNGGVTNFQKRNKELETFVALERTHASTKKQIYWEIGRRCNYDCGYCWPWIHNNTEQHKTLEVLMSATKKLEETFTKGQSVNFIISGGEPTVNPGFLEWLTYLNTQGHHISLHSNGSRLPKYYRDVIHYGDLNLSVHFEFYNKDKFLKVVEAVLDEKIKHDNEGVGHLEIKVMMPPGFLEKALELENDLKNISDFINYCTWAFVPIRGTMQNKDAERIKGIPLVEVMPEYTEQEIKLFGAGY
jgi:MoaA/NifB/PqqE/SkfB family radical SAM enzyme